MPVVTLRRPSPEAVANRVRDGENSLLSLDTIRVGGRSYGGDETKVPLPALTRMRLGDRPPAGHRTFRVATADAGDERFSWDANDSTQIAEAHRFFVEMVAKGMTPYRLDPRGKQSGVVMVEFDPLAEEVLFAPTNVPKALVGG